MAKHAMASTSTSIRVSRLGNWALPGRWFVAGLGVLAYVAGEPVLFRTFGPQVDILAILPVAMVGWAAGARAGVAAGLLALPVNVALYHLVDPNASLSTLTASGEVADAFAVFATGALVGYLRDADRGLKAELAERRRAEAALRESEARKAAILESSADCIIAVDAAGVILEFNSASERVFGYRREYCVGQRMVELIIPRRLRSSTWETMRNLMDTPEGTAHGRHFETVALRSDGREMPVEISLGIHRVASQVVCSASMRDITERKRQAAALEYQAYHDHLTDLPNRVLFLDRLQQALHTAERESRLVALLMLDLDGFKDVNDGYGHHVGDQLLKQVARRLRAEVRASDTVARLGGDEFSVIVPAVADLNGVEALATKISGVLARSFEIDGQSFEIRASIGMALFPQHGQDVDTLIKHSDAAMYQAKRSRSASRLWTEEGRSRALGS